MFSASLRSLARQAVRPAACAVAAAAVANTSTPQCLRVEEDVKLDFKDVLIRPKRSTLKSRSEVTLSRPLKFKHSGRTLDCVPIVVANMDTVGTFEMAEALCEHGCLVAVHKHYPVEDWAAFVKRSPKAAQHVAVSMGTSASDAAKVETILAQCPEVTTICIDVANG